MLPNQYYIQHFRFAYFSRWRWPPPRALLLFSNAVTFTRIIFVFYCKIVFFVWFCFFFFPLGCNTIRNVYLNGAVPRYRLFFYHFIRFNIVLLNRVAYVQPYCISRGSKRTTADITNPETNVSTRLRWLQTTFMKTFNAYHKLQLLFGITFVFRLIVFCNEMREKQLGRVKTPGTYQRNIYFRIAEQCTGLFVLANCVRIIL